VGMLTPGPHGVRMAAAPVLSCQVLADLRVCARRT
jgi:hypothetical protein